MPTNAEVLTGLLVSERTGLLRLLGRSLNPDAAEDVYQGIYLKVSALPAEIRIEDARAYLYRLAYHEAISHGRRAASEQRLLAEVAQLLGQARVPDTAHTATAQIELRRAMRAVLQLPQPMRRIFALSVYQDLSERAIAAQLGMSRATVARHLRRALHHVARLRDQA